ncbi:MAG: outer membrane beta-barrel protein [Bacteroidota bacterium]
MKKKLLALGSALMLLTSTAKADAGDMSYGLQAGGSLAFPTVGETTIGGTKHKESFLNLFVAGGLFFKYEVIDMMTAGIKIGYNRIGLNLEKEGSTEAKDAYSLRIHTLNAAIPVAFLPMGREGGLEIFLGPKAYFPLMSSESKPGSTDSKNPEDSVVTGFNIGATVGTRYEILESGFSVGANYDFFFMSMFGKEAKNKSIDGLEDKTYFPQGVELTLGYDFSRLMEE